MQVTDPDGLGAIVKRHHVEYEVWPDKVHHDGHLVTTGFHVELSGCHGAVEHAVEAGCDECLRLFGALRRIAQAALPEERASTRLRIRPFEPRLELEHGSPTPRVVLTIEIFHRDDAGGGEVDDCERACLAKVRAALDSLDVRRGPRQAVA